MTVPHLPDRDAAQVDALVADHYLANLLASAARPAAADDERDGAAAIAGLDPLDPADLPTARLLRESMVRVHPSFRFEERLAARLADLAAAQAGEEAAAVAGGGGSVIPFPGRSAGSAARAALPAAHDPLLDQVLAGDLDPADPDAVARAEGVIDRRPLIVGGAITSAALSIAGVAWVAWRASRPTDKAATAMGRAVRTAHARRAARTASLAGLGGPA